MARLESALWPELRRYWHPVAYDHEVTDRPVPFILLNERIAVCRLGGRPAAFKDLCIHRGTPISLGSVEGEEIVCAYHGWSYNAEGKCTRIPSIPPEHPIPKKACLETYRVREKYGLVWVLLGEERTPIPDYPVFEDPDFEELYRKKLVQKCSAARATENFIDQGHFPWVHEGILGSRENARVPDAEIDRDGEDLCFRLDTYADTLHPVPHRRNYRLTRPFTIYQWKEEADGKTEVYLNVSTPNSAGECTRFMIIARNYKSDRPEGAKREQLTDTVMAQDLVIIENQRPEELPLDLSEELHVKGPDAIALEYRRFLAELGVE